MRDADRVQHWRQWQRKEGKEPMTLWLSQATKSRLENLAHVWHRSPSEMVEQALAQFHPGTPSVPRTGAALEQLQALVTDMVRDTLARDLPWLVRAMLQDLELPLAPQQTDAHHEPSTASMTANSTASTDGVS
jgi:predicted transcriptional regulator